MTERPQAAHAAAHEHENAFEASARIVIQFIVRAAILPYTLLMANPRNLERAVTTGNYRPLPSPFLLALTAGVVVSGAVSGIGVFFSENKTWSGALNEYIAAVGRFYAESTDELAAILYAIPYVFVLWFVAALVSLFMLRSARNAEAIFAVISLCLAALIEVFAILFALVSFEPFTRIPAIELLIIAGVVIYAAVLAAKLVRVLFIISHNNSASRPAAALATAPCLLLVLVLGLAGAGLLWGMVVLQRNGGEKKIDFLPGAARGEVMDATKAPDAENTSNASNETAETLALHANPTPVVVTSTFRR